jgi:hypothetical protein
MAGTMDKTEVPRLVGGGATPHPADGLRSYRHLDLRKIAP